jgi:hypothetical protein
MGVAEVSLLQIFLLVVVHFPQKSRIYAWIPSVLNSQKQHTLRKSRLKEIHLSFHIREA